MRTSRADWAKRAERWKDSGLTAKEFASEFGCNARSLVFWRWQLKKEADAGKRCSLAPKPRTAQSMALLPLVEVSAPPIPDRFELELHGGRRLTIPSNFEEQTLRRLLAVESRA